MSDKEFITKPTHLYVRGKVVVYPKIGDEHTSSVVSAKGWDITIDWDRRVAIVVHPARGVPAYIPFENIECFDESNRGKITPIALSGEKSAPAKVADGRGVPKQLA